MDLFAICRYGIYYSFHLSVALTPRPCTRHSKMNFHVSYLDGGLEDVKGAVLIANGSGCVADQLSVGAHPVSRRLRVADRLAAKADLLTLHHKHFGGVTSDHRRLAHKLLLVGESIH